MGDLKNGSWIKRLLTPPGAVSMAAILCAFLLVESIQPAFWPREATWLAVLVIVLIVSALVLHRERKLRNELVEHIEQVRTQLDRQTTSLHESEARYRKVFDTVADGVLLLDQDGLIVASNARLAATHGWTQRQLVGRPVTLLLRTEDHALAQILHTPPADRPVVLSMHACDREGHERETEATAVRVLFQGRPHALVILRDVAVMHHLEHRLLHAQRYESVGHMAEGIAHDLNNILTPVLGYSEMLLAREELCDDSRADLLAIQRAGERAHSLACRLLAYSSRQIAAMQELDLVETIAAREPLLRHVLQDGIELKLSLPDEVHLVRADPGQIEQMLMILAINAKEAMPGGGILAISLTRHVAGSCLRVRDNGPGIPQDALDRFSDPLQTAKRAGRGAGMGLTAVRSIVKRQNGSLTMRNHPKGGCEALILLPRSAGTEQTPSDRSQNKRGLSGTA